MSRFAVSLLIIVILIVMWSLAQGIGESVGHGLTEWSVR